MLSAGCAHVGPSRAHVEPSWAHLGLMLGQVGRWAHLGPILGLCWAHLEPMLGLCCWPMLSHELCFLRPGPPPGAQNHVKTDVFLTSPR